MIAPWVIEHFPRHRVYVEPFGGAASVLIRKPRSYAEVYNDLDHQVVNLFSVLRSPALAAALLESLRLTPFARQEFDDATATTEDPVEKARRLVIRSFMGFGSNAHSSSRAALKTGFRSWTGDRKGESWRSTGFRSNSNRSGTTPAHDWANYPDALPALIERFRRVVVESKDALELMPQHDGPETLFYVDPPYLPETRSPANRYDGKNRMYRHELTRDDHVELLEFLKGLKGMVVLSGYPSKLYDDALYRWTRDEREAMADGARPRIEVLWMNEACEAGLRDVRAGQGSPLFGATV